MEGLDPEKLSVEFRSGATPAEPVIGRKYTLTHSDETAELYLTIGLDYAVDQINWMRDEVLAEWVLDKGNIFLQVYVYVSGSYGSSVAEIRDKISAVKCRWRWKRSDTGIVIFLRRTLSWITLRSGSISVPKTRIITALNIGEHLQIMRDGQVNEKVNR